MELISEIFSAVAEMSEKSCVVIAVVLLACLLLRKAPKRFSYVLWLAVGFRLIMPFSIPSRLSIFNLGMPSAGVGTAVSYGAYYIEKSYNVPQIHDNVQNTVANQAGNSAVTSEINTLQILGIIWILGMAVMLMCGIISYVNLKKKVRTAVRRDGNIYECEKICSPFILGIVKPKIYVPFRLGDDEFRYVVCHERCHMKRMDHIVKPISYVILSVHWFNPLVWLSFYMMTKYMEMSCDEKVITVMGSEIKKAYSMSLLSFGANKRIYSAFSPSFAETGTKERVRHVLNFKKSKIWVVVIAVILCAAVIAGCTTDAGKETGDIDNRSFTQRLYDAKNLYIGDASSDNNLLMELGIGENIGGYTIELQTNEEPYGLTVNFKDEVSELKSVYIDKEMTNNAALLLALIDNAGTVNWRYTLDGQTVERQLTIADADKLVNGSIKDCGRTVEELQKLIDILYADESETQTGGDIQADSLDEAVSKAIIEYNSSGNGSVTVEAHTTLLTDEKDDKTTVYVMAMAADVVLNGDGSITETSASHMPAALTFTVKENNYTLTEYWTPMDGAAYEKSIREKFPEEIADDAMDTQKYVDEHTKKCLEKANEYFGVSNSGWSEPVSESNIYSKYKLVCRYDLGGSSADKKNWSNFCESVKKGEDSSITVYSFTDAKEMVLVHVDYKNGMFNVIEDDTRVRDQEEDYYNMTLKYLVSDEKDGTISYYLTDYEDFDAETYFQKLLDSTYSSDVRYGYPLLSYRAIHE